MTTVTITGDGLSQRLDDLGHMIVGGTDNTSEDWAAAWGTPCTLIRMFRDGTVTKEVLPRWLALLTVADIPACEPNVARARLVEDTSSTYLQPNGELKDA